MMVVLRPAVCSLDNTFTLLLLISATCMLILLTETLLLVRLVPPVPSRRVLLTAGAGLAALVTIWAGIQYARFIPFCTGLNYGSLLNEQSAAFAILSKVAVPAIVVITVVLLLLGLAWTHSRRAQ